ncbi:MAG: metallophosphoesterase [Desulfobulbaceae bacterium]|nr:metallophosphoesterase [Desulfobulbaceae bacterium]
MKAIWLTDIHLEFLSDSACIGFLEKLNDKNADAVLITGDIAQATTIEKHLSRMTEELAAPIYFVLGNHDYYYGSVDGVRSIVAGLTRRSPHLHWLNNCGPVKLTGNTCLIGHDGWGDARLGDYDNTRIKLNDFRLISELTGLSKEDLRNTLQRLGDEAADHFRAVLPKALEIAGHVVVLTHVPPFPEATWHEGNYSDNDWLPFFSCKAVGDVLFESMQNNPHKRMTVLCGHTHGGGKSQILPNLVTLTGQARYGYPVIQEIFEWDD